MPVIVGLFALPSARAEAAYAIFQSPLPSLGPRGKKRDAGARCQIYAIATPVGARDRTSPFEPAKMSANCAQPGTLLTREWDGHLQGAGFIAATVGAVIGSCLPGS